MTHPVRTVAVDFYVGPIFLFQIFDDQIYIRLLDIVDLKPFPSRDIVMSADI